jgi:hypothetical protein
MQLPFRIKYCESEQFRPDPYRPRQYCEGTQRGRSIEKAAIWGRHGLVSPSLGALDPDLPQFTPVVTLPCSAMPPLGALAFSLQFWPPQPRVAPRRRVATRQRVLLSGESTRRPRLLPEHSSRVLPSLHFSDVARFGIEGAVIIRFLAIGGLTFGLAALSKKFLEDPFLRFEPSVAPVPSGRLSRLLLFHPRLMPTHRAGNK